MAACSDSGTTRWIGVIESKAAPPYADFTTESGTFETLADCERAMKTAAGTEKEKPAAREDVVVRTLFYRCREGKENTTERLIATKYLLLPANP